MKKERRIAKVVLQQNPEWTASVFYRQRHKSSSLSVVHIPLPLTGRFYPSVADAQYEICLILSLEEDGETATFNLQTDGTWMWEGNYH